MRVTHVALDDFRSYRHAVVEFAPGTTVLVGSNGQGKTNLVEAIAYLSAFSSHRVSAESALVRLPLSEDEAAPGGAVVRVKLVTAGEREHVIELEIVRGKANRAKLNRTQVRPRDVLGMVKTVVFSPEDLGIVRGDPSVRRTFIDDLLIQMNPMMAQVKNDYDKVARQRAALMKQAQSQLRRGKTPDLSTLQIWDDTFAVLSVRLSRARRALIAELREPASSAYAQVADSPRTLDIDYVSSLDQTLVRLSQPAVETEGVSTLLNTDETPGFSAENQQTEHRLANDDDGAEDCTGGNDAPAYTESEEEEIHRMHAALAHVRTAETERGVNLVGAHRDDMRLTLGGMPVKGYASHGESWSVALALRLGAYELLKEDDDTPILILDDVFAELDAARRLGLTRMVSDAEQVLVTAAVAEDVPEELRASMLRVTWDPRTGTAVAGGDDE